MQTFTRLSCCLCVCGPGCNCMQRCVCVCFLQSTQSVSGCDPECGLACYETVGKGNGSVCGFHSVSDGPGLPPICSLGRVPVRNKKYQRRQQCVLYTRTAQALKTVASHTYTSTSFQPCNCLCATKQWTCLTNLLVKKCLFAHFKCAMSKRCSTECILKQFL